MLLRRPQRFLKLRGKLWLPRQQAYTASFGVLSVAAMNNCRITCIFIPFRRSALLTARLGSPWSWASIQARFQKKLWAINLTAARHPALTAILNQDSDASDLVWRWIRQLVWAVPNASPG
jgi:hypothetical protein